MSLICGHNVLARIDELAVGAIDSDKKIVSLCLSPWDKEIGQHCYGQAISYTKTHRTLSTRSKSLHIL